METMEQLIEEARLARKLCNEIEQITHQYGEGIVPHNVFVAFQNLMKMYQRHISDQ